MHSDEHLALTSNSAAFVLRPTVSVDLPTGSDTLTLTPVPPIGPGQAVQVRFDPVQSAADAHVVALPASPTAQEHLSVSLDALPAGDYFVRLQVDGALSPLRFDQAGGFTGPRVTVTDRAGP